MVEMTGEMPTPGRPRRRLALVIGLVVLAGIVLLGVVAAGTFRQFAHVAFIPSAAMEPTYPAGSRVLVVRPPEDGPRAGDVIIHTKPGVPSGSFIKRIVAVGPATVAFADGRVVVGGQPLDEPYLPPGTQTRGASAQLGMPCSPTQPCTVGEGELYVLGDNRENAEDSRHHGPVRRETVTGVVSRKLFG
jgi:signal peptidase I